MAARYMRLFLRLAAEHFGCHPALDSWILGNEVNFYSTASPHAAAKFAAFLRTKYSGHLERLQQARVILPAVTP